MPGVQTITVSKEESGQKLLQFLQRRVGKDVPKSAVMKWIRKGEVRVNKGRKKPFDRVQEGQSVRIPPYKTADTNGCMALPGLPICLENDRLVVVAKPSGLASHGGDRICDSVAARIKCMFQDAPFMPGLAHRLDRDTSGLLVVGKTYESLRALNDAFATGTVGKLYLARVHGNWRHEGTVLLEDDMEKQGKPGREKVVTGSGKTARAEVTPLKTGRQHSLLAIRLLTGRTHQIRVQLASRGHAVVGDVKYGNDAPPLLLHCFGLIIPDANGKQELLSLPPQWPGKAAPGVEELKKASEILQGLLPVA